VASPSSAGAAATLRLIGMGGTGVITMGEADLVQRALDDTDQDLRATSLIGVGQATVRLARDDPEGAAAALEPIFAGGSPIDDPRWEIEALLLKAGVEDALGDTGASSRALERELELAEPDGVLRHLPTDPRTPEIAAELFVTRNTIRTHIRNACNKLGVHSHADAINRARELSLRSPSLRKR
jgi:Bacterial regulatory proteins, luxR family